jgi:hypothetical protein
MGDGSPLTNQYSDKDVQALIDNLARNAVGENNHFAGLLLERFGSFAEQPVQELDEDTKVDLLLEILRALLETEIESALEQLGREDLNRKETNRLAALFWGALTLHAELFLRLPAPGNTPLVDEIGGEYVVKLPGVVPYTFQEPFSAARLKSLFSTLGTEWLMRYLDACILNKKIPQLFHDTKQRQITITEWIGLISVRTLERAQKQVRSRLWEQYGVEKKPVLGRRSIRLEMSPASLTNRKPEQTRPVNWIQDFQAVYKRGLLEKFSGMDSQPFVRPELQVEDGNGNLGPANLDDLVHIDGLCLLAGLPGGGKSYLQAWAARQRLLDRGGLDIFVNLDEYTRSGLTSLFEFAADKLRCDFDLPAGQDELRSALIELDRQGKILWRVDNWDRLRPEERERALVGLSGLTNALITTSDPREFARLAQERSRTYPQRVYHILPWSRAKQAEYLSLYEQVHPTIQRDLVMSLMEQLPGLARLPGGMAHLLTRKVPGLVEALLDYLDAHQKARGNTSVTLCLGSNLSHQAVDWSSADLNIVYAGVYALMQHGLGRRYEPSQLEQFDRVILGACLPEKRESLEARMQRSDTLLEAGVQAGLLTRIGTDSYAFVVPEIGYLLSALAVYASRLPETVQTEAQTYASQNPAAPAVAVLMDFAHWYSQSGEARYESTLLPLWPRPGRP